MVKNKYLSKRIIKNSQEIVRLYREENVSVRDICKMFHAHGIGIRALLKANGFNTSERNKFPIARIEWQTIVDRYKAGEDGAKIAKSYNMNDTNFIYKILRRYECKIRTKDEYQRKYTVNINYFDKIDTRNKAYILGILYADGYNKNTSFSLDLHNRDIDILKKVAKEINYNGPFYQRKDQPASCLRITNAYICKKLAELGCFRKKSLTLEFPNSQQVPYCFMSHFLRGYSDGDGCIYISKDHKKFSWSLIGSKSFILSVKKFLESTFNIYCSMRNRGNVAELTVCSKKSAIKVLDWLYRHAMIYMNRKHQKYLEIKNG